MATKPRDGETLLLGLDIGTTRIKAGVVGAGGRELAWGSVETPWQRAATGAEMRAEDLLAGVLRAAAAALDAAPPGPVAGAGVTSMAETAVWLDASGQPCAPCVAWYDTRGEEEARQLENAFGGEAFSQRTGLPPSSMCTLVKLAWLARQGGQVPMRALSVADWVVHTLGGEQMSEASLASRTGALDIPGRRWWDEAIQWAGAGTGLFPPVVQAGEPAGKVTLERVEDRVTALTRERVTGEGLASLARLEGAVLASAGHDHLSAAAGAGALTTGQVLDSCGTSEALVRAVTPLDGAALGRAVAAGLAAGWHVVPGHHVLLVGGPLGMLLERVLRLLGKAGPAAVEDLDALSSGVAPGPLRVVGAGFFADPSVKGLHADVSPEALWGAALDEVASVAARELETVQAFAGPAKELLLSGGWARFAGIRRRRVGLLPRVRWPAVAEAGARGAALFGGCAAGIFEGPAGFPELPDRALGVATTPAHATKTPLATTTL